MRLEVNTASIPVDQTTANYRSLPGIYPDRHRQAARFINLADGPRDRRTFAAVLFVDSDAKTRPESFPVGAGDSVPNGSFFFVASDRLDRRARAGSSPAFSFFEG
jgi:hypothetical protein